MSVSFGYSRAGNMNDAAIRQFAVTLLDRLSALPGLEAAAIATSVPLDIHGLPSRFFTLEGRARDDDGFDEALANTVTPGYFTVMGLPILAGRGFADLRDPAAPQQVVVNEEFVRRFADGREVIDRRIGVMGAQTPDVLLDAMRQAGAVGDGAPASP